MECIVCSCPDAGHRAVVRVESSDRVGGVCESCERAVFGSILTQYEDEDGSCVVCGAPGAYRLPRRPDPGEEADTDVEITVYELHAGEPTPVFCAAHYQGLLAADPHR